MHTKPTNLFSGAEGKEFNVATKEALSEVAKKGLTLGPNPDYESEEDAINNINNIENQSAYNNIVPFSQQIFARIVPDSNPNCFSIGNFLIETINPPDIIVQL